MNKFRELLAKIPQDKQKHIGVGLLIGLAIGYYPLIAAITVVVIGVGKEIYDYIINKYFKGHHGVEVLDAVATIIGGIIGIVLIEGIKLLVGGLL